MEKLLIVDDEEIELDGIRPSMTGILMSVITMSGCFSCISARPRLPLTAVPTSS